MAKKDTLLEQVKRGVENLLEDYDVLKVETRNNIVTVTCDDSDWVEYAVSPTYVRVLDVWWGDSTYEGTTTARDLEVFIQSLL